MRYSKQRRYFNGFVRDPVPIVFLIVFVGLCVVAVAIFCTVTLVKDEDDMINLQQVTTKINHIETKENVVYLHTNMGIFSVPNDLICNYSSLNNSVANFNEFQIHYKPLSENNKLEGLVRRLADSTGLIYVTEEAVREYKKESNRMATTAAWSIVVIYSIFSLCIWYFLSNATKYPRIAALMVKRQWRNF